MNPKCSRRSLLGAIFLLFLLVSRLGQCWCGCCRRRRRRCCCRRRRLPRPRGLHYRVLQGGLCGRCGAWDSLIMNQEGRGITALPSAPGICSEASPRALGSGVQCWSWPTSPLGGGGARFGGGGGRQEPRPLASPAPPPSGRQTAADAQWVLVPTSSPIRALVGENLIFTPFWREKQACLDE